MSGWSNSNTYALTNYNKLFFAIVVTCDTGSFDGGTARSEAFLRAGTAASPRAAVGAIGTSTIGTHTRYNNCYTYGTYQGLLYEDQWEMGAAHTRGKYELYANYQQTEPTSVIKFTHWNNLMGDPACRVWSAYPQTLMVQSPEEIPLGATSATVRVTTLGGTPVPDAQVCLLQDGEFCSVGQTGADGYCELEVSAATAGLCRLTVTKHNCRPVLQDVAIAQAVQFVGYLSSSVDDDDQGASQGNGDARLNPGETIELTARLKNFGTQTAADVTAVLESEDPYLTLLQASSAYGSIPVAAMPRGMPPMSCV